MDMKTKCAKLGMKDVQETCPAKGLYRLYTAFSDKLHKKVLQKVVWPELVAWQEGIHLHKAAFSFVLQHLAQALPKQGFLHCALRKGPHQ